MLGTPVRGAGRILRWHMAMTPAVLFASVNAAEACLCGGLANPCASLGGYHGEIPGVFEGTVATIEKRVIEDTHEFNGQSRVLQRGMMEVRFRGVTHLLGERGTVVLTGTGGGNCGYERFSDRTAVRGARHSVERRSHHWHLFVHGACGRSA